MARKYVLHEDAELDPSKRQRVTLSKSDLKTELGQVLLSFLYQLTEDGELTAPEISALGGWLDQIEDRSIPAVVFLKEKVREMLADSVLTPDEQLELFLAIERVLPKEYREAVRLARLRVQGVDAKSPAWKRDPVTDKQRDFILSLGADPASVNTKGEASELIDSILNGDWPASNRQIMVLRFWNLEGTARNGRKAISEWMDAFYTADPDRLAAWNLWKEENDDRGRQDDPSVVPVGLGTRYLARVKAKRKSGLGGCLKISFLGLVALVGIAWLLEAFATPESPRATAPISHPPNPQKTEQQHPSSPPEPTAPSLDVFPRSVVLKKEVKVKLDYGIVNVRPGQKVDLLRKVPAGYEAKYGQYTFVIQSGDF